MVFFFVLWVFCCLSGVLVCFVLWVSFFELLWLVEMSGACICSVTTGGLMLLFVLLLVEFLQVVRLMLLFVLRLVESHGL